MWCIDTTVTTKEHWYNLGKQGNHIHISRQSSYICVHVTCVLLLSVFNHNQNVSTNFSKKSPASIFVPLLPVGVEFFHTYKEN